MSKKERKIAKAALLGYQVAYSHQAFEYWLLLHFEDHQGGAMDRKLYHDKINKHLINLNFKSHYDKNQKNIDKKLFNILLGVDEKTGKSRQVLAIERARKIYERLDHSNPAQEESSTTVFQLVNRLNHET
jgi:RloB-like protein